MTDHDETPPLTAGGALFGKLKALGVDYVFANSGTDFPPIIEGLIAARNQDIPIPQALTIPHEHVAVGMAHGYYLMSGKAQAVMLHTNVGLANGATGAINAACDQVPMFLMSGRTPVSEHSRYGARTVPIGWGQEMYDQSALVREACKWDYELRFPDQVSDVLDRGWSIANSTPKGPVYLSLPREVLCEPCPTEGLDQPSAMAPALTSPDRAALKAAADLLANAKRPMIIAQRGVKSEKAFKALTQFVEDRGIPVAQYWANRISIPMSSDSHIGWFPDAALKDADVVLVIDALAPWWPDRAAPDPDAKIIQLGPDPLFARSSPMRTFRSDVTLSGDTDAALLDLIDLCKTDVIPTQNLRAKNRENTKVLSAQNHHSVRAQALTGCKTPMSKEWVSHCLGQAIKGLKASVFHELGCPLPALELEQYQNYFQEPHSGGLGWGFPAAMGAQLADPERLIFATMGDGSYMFANPTACHQVCEALGLPVIVLVLNNEEWGAVRHSVEGMYKDGLAPKTNDVPLTSLRPSPDFTMTAQASRAYTETVRDGKAVPDVLERAIKVATQDRRQVLLNIEIERTGPH